MKATPRRVPRNAPRPAGQAGEAGEAGTRGEAAAVKQAKPAGTASASAGYLLDRLGKLLAEDRSREIAEATDIVVSAKKLFVYGVGRSGVAARAFAIRMVQLGLACFFIGEAIT